MRSSNISVFPLTFLVILGCLAVSVGALAQSNGRQSGNGPPRAGAGYQGYHGGPGGYYPAYAGYPVPGASANFATSTVSMSVGSGGGVSVNIANVGAASSFMGYGGVVGFVGPWVGGSFAGVPGFAGGSVFSGNGINGLSLQLGGGTPASGGTNINIANVAFSSAYYWGPAVGYYYVPVRAARQAQPAAATAQSSGGNGEGSSGGGADGAGEGGGAY